MSIVDQEEHRDRFKKLDNATSRELREMSANGAKDFKTSWLRVSQALYAIWRDKLYEYWGYEKFDHFTAKECGFKKSVAMKMVKAYSFVENQVPDLLTKEYMDAHTPADLPDFDAISVLRSAHGRKELVKQDYLELRRHVIEKGCSAAEARRGLKHMISERRRNDPEFNEEETKEQERVAAIRKLFNAVKAFKNMATVLKSFDKELVKKVEDIQAELHKEM